MTKDELIERLKAHEWNDVEFKEAQRETPQNCYETVSAFSNTGGGWLVFREGIQRPVNRRAAMAVGSRQKPQTKSLFDQHLRKKQILERYT